MINEENLTKMYDGVLNEQELTTKELNGYGFNSKDLTDLIENGTLERIKRGYYSFKSIDDLFYYGKKLIAIEEYDKAAICFLKCYELDPNHLGASFQLFLRSIQNKNYEKAFEYFDHIYDTDNEYYNASCNYYLYLLSMITELPEKYKKQIQSLKLTDIIVYFDDRKRCNAISNQNKVRISSFNQKFALALKQLDDVIKQKGGMNAQNIITKTLLTQAIRKQKKNKKHIVDLINEKKYEEVIKFLENIQEQHNLNQADECTLALIKDLVQIIRTGIIPEKQVISTDKLFDAISGKNYELALALSTEYNKKNSIGINDNAIYILLTEIQNLIDKKKNGLAVEAQRTIEDYSTLVEQQEKQKDQPKSKIVSSSCKSTFADVVGYLMKNDLDNGFITLRNYLDNIGKREYEFLIIDLIKISLIDNDIAFAKPMIALTYLTRENFEFDISKYIQNFYEELSQNNFDKARIYLDIISKSKDLGQSCILTEGLEQVLNNTEKMLNYKRNNETLNEVEQATQNIKTNETPVISESGYAIKSTFTDFEEEPIQPVIGEKPSQEKKQSVNKTDQLKNKDYDDQEFINQKLETVYEKGIVLLKPMDSERRKEIHDIVKNIPDVVSFSIGENNKRQIVLRFKPYVAEYVNPNELLKAGSKAYKIGDYDTCIDCYRRRLESGEPKAFVYSELGLAYMKKFDDKTAIDYLTVATELSKKEDGRFDFTELIAVLKGLIPDEDKKTYVKMSESDFENDINDHYGVEQVEQIAELVSSGATIDDACLRMGLDDEQKCLVLLIFAKECYAQENYANGDQYLKKVERTKNKSKFVKALFKEISKNKRFYKNRIDENQKRLILTSK